MVGKQFALGFLACLLLVACAGMKVKYYTFSQVDYNQGMLLGPKESDDIPFSKCAPVGNDANPCILMFREDFIALKQDYLDTKQKLKECQKK
jgi:hypothetical protein